jgi:hypothetical protein
LGGGGGGMATGTSGSGGSGVVIIRYATSSGTATGGTITTDGAYKVHKFVLADTGTNFVFTEVPATTNYLSSYRNDRLSFG